MNAEQEMQAMVIETDNPVRVRRFFMSISKFAAAYHEKMFPGYQSDFLLTALLSCKEDGRRLEADKSGSFHMVKEVKHDD